MLPDRDSGRRYYGLSAFYRDKFGGRVAKIPLDAGFACPNIDGSRGSGGCVFCTRAGETPDSRPLLEQFEAGKAALLRKWGDNARYIPYFQSGSNTYAPVETLRALYEPFLSLEEVVGLSVATRPDCLPPQVLDYLEDVARRTFLTVELGLQSAHDGTGRRINRCHDWATFIKGTRSLTERGIRVCVHIINGLPGENRDTMVETAHKLAELRPGGVKIHLLHVLEGTPLARMYEAGEFRLLELDEYVEIVCDQLELLPQDIVIERITGDGDQTRLDGPLWSKNKRAVLAAIDRELARRDVVQGVYARSHQDSGIGKTNGGTHP